MTIQSDLDAGAEELGQLRVKVPVAIRSSAVILSSRNFLMVIVRALRRDGRDDDVDTGAIGEARVDHGRRFVDAAAQRRDDALGDAQDVVGVAEADGAQVEPAFLLDRRWCRAR